jgi:xanthine dehydrogenase accessory factor
MERDQYRVLIRGGGELGSATAHHLFTSGFTRILIAERRFPKAVRRQVCFCEAVHDGRAVVDGVEARFATAVTEVEAIHAAGHMAVMALPLEKLLDEYRPDVLVEAAMLRENWGLTRDMAPVVIALGPGYTAGRDCHAVVATVRGPQVGSVLEDTGEFVENRPPAEIMGFTGERALKAARDGIFFTHRAIGDEVERGERVGTVVSVYGVDDYRRGVPVDASYTVTARIGGVVRGLLRDGMPVKKGDRIGDVDPRGRTDDLNHISDKSRRVAEGVHEALLGLIDHLPVRSVGGA